MDIVQIGGETVRVDGKDLFSAAVDVPIELKSIDAAKRSVWAVFSSDAKDLERDIVKQAGWDLSRIRKNPISLYMHNPTQPPIATIEKIKKNMKARPGMAGDHMSMARFRFPTPGGYELADVIWFLIEQEMIRAVSAGFLPMEMKDLFANDEGREYYDGREIIKALLLEISWGAIPMNQDSLIASEKAKAAGLDAGRVKALIEGDPEASTDGRLYLPGAELTKAEDAILNGTGEHIERGTISLVYNIEKIESDDGEEIDTVTKTADAILDIPDEGVTIETPRGSYHVTKELIEDAHAMGWPELWKTIETELARIMKDGKPPKIEGDEAGLNHYLKNLFEGASRAGEGDAIAPDPDGEGQGDEGEQVVNALKSIRDELNGEAEGN